MFTSSHSRKRSAGGNGNGGGGGAIYPYSNEMALRIKANEFVGLNNNVVLDSSDNNYTITRSNTVSQGRYSAFSPNGYSGHFDGTNDYITAPGSDAFRFGTGDFTVEFFMRPTNWTANGQGIAGLKVNDTSTGWVIYNNGTSTKLHARIGGSGTGADFVSTADVDKGVWQHWALVRGNGTLRWYKNGVQCGSSSLAIHLGNINDLTGLFTIGHTQTWSGNAKFRGHISELHIAKKALYTDNFTPPVGHIQPVTETTFLSLNRAYLKDDSTFNAALTPVMFPDLVNSSANILDAYDVDVHGGGFHFNGASSSLSLPLDVLKSITNSHSTCCVEGFFKIHIKGTQNLFYLNRESTSSYAELSLGTDSSGTLSLRVPYWDGSAWAWYVLSITYTHYNQYVHIAVVKSGTTFKLYVAGTLRGTLEAPLFVPFTQTGLTSWIGSNNASTFPFRGDMSSFRIVEGSEVYTGNFSIPTGPLAKIAGTKLLLLGNNANIIDSTNRNNLLTVGDARIEQTIVKEGLGSLYFDGTGDYIRVSTTSGLNGSVNRNANLLMLGSEFRVSGWAYSIGASGATRKTIVSTKPATAEVAGTLALYIENNVFRLTWAGGAMNTGINAPRDGWFHWAIIRVGTNVSVFINGTWSGILSAAVPLEISTGFSLGANYDGTEPFYGYMDSIELELGKSSVVNTFLAPTDALPEKTNEVDPDFKYNILQLAINGAVGERTLTNKTISDKVDFYSKEAATLTGTSDYIQTANYGPFSRSKSAMLCAEGLGGASFSTQSITNLFYGKKVTIEAWIFPTGYHASSGTYTGIIFSNRDATTNSGQLEFGYYGNAYSESYQLGLFSGRSGTIVKSNILGKLKQWAHVVVEIDLTVPGTANEVVFFINGAREVATHNFSTMAAGAVNHNLSIGKSSANTTSPTVGYIEEFRLVADANYVYNASMVVPTDELTNVPGTMLRTNSKRNHARNELSPNRFRTSGVNKFNFSRKDIVTDVDLSPDFNSGYISAAFNAVNDGQRNYGFALVTKNSDFYDIGTGDVTIECFYEPVVTTNRILNILDASHDSTIRIGGNATAYYSYQFGTSSLNIGATTNNNTNIVAGEMVHLAIVRKNGVVKFYIDGVVYDSKPNTDYIRISKLRLGGNDGVVNSFSNGMFGIAQITARAKYDGDFVTDDSVKTNDVDTLFTLKFKNPMVYDTTGNCKLLAGTGMTSGLASDIYLSSVFNAGNKRSIRTDINTSVNFAIKRPVNIARNDVSFEFVLNGGEAFDIDTGGVSNGFFALSYNGTNLLLYLRNTGATSWNLVNGTAINGTLSTTEPTHICVRKIGDVVTVYVNGVIKHNRVTVTGYQNYIPELYISAKDIREIRVTEGTKRYVDNVIDV